MLRIGSAEGFYGDDVTRALPMIEGGHVSQVERPSPAFHVRCRAILTGG